VKNRTSLHFFVGHLWMLAYVTLGWKLAFIQKRLMLYTWLAVCSL